MYLCIYTYLHYLSPPYTILFYTTNHFTTDLHFSYECPEGTFEVYSAFKREQLLFPNRICLHLSGWQTKSGTAASTDKISLCTAQWFYRWTTFQQYGNQLVRRSLLLHTSHGVSNLFNSKMVLRSELPRPPTHHPLLSSPEKCHWNLPKKPWEVHPLPVLTKMKGQTPRM